MEHDRMWKNPTNIGNDGTSKTLFELHATKITGFVIHSVPIVRVTVSYNCD